MPKKAPTTTDEVLPETIDDPTAGLRAMLGAITGEPGQYVLKFFRLPTRQYIPADCEPDQFSLKDFALQWGGGRYFVQLVGPGNTFVKGSTLEIDPSIKPRPAIVPTAAEPARSVEPSYFERALEAEKQRSHELQMKFMELAAARSGQAQGQGMTLKEAMELAHMLAKKGDGGGLGDALKAFREFRQLGEEIGSPGGGSDDWGSIVKAFATFVLQQPTPAPHQPGEQPQLPPPAPPTTPLPPSPAALIDPQSVKVIATLFLAGQATGGDPETYGDMLADSIDAMSEPERRKVLDLPAGTLVEMFCAMEPVLVPIKAFVREVEDAARKALNDPERYK